MGVFFEKVVNGFARSFILDDCQGSKYAFESDYFAFILGTLYRYIDFLDLSKTLTLKDQFISESCIEIKIKLNFYIHTSLWCLKRFYEGLEALHRSVKIKI